MINGVNGIDDDSETSLVEKYVSRAPCSANLSADAVASPLALRWAIRRWTTAVETEGCVPVGDPPVADFVRDPLTNITEIIVHGRVVPVTEEARRKAALREREANLGGDGNA